MRWLAASGESRYIVDRKLDSLATSMRDFDDVAPHLESLALGEEPEHPDSAQRIVDLRGASLADPRRTGLSALGTAVLRAWKRYGVADAQIQHELPRHLLLIIEAIRLENRFYIDCVRYWREIAGRFGAENLLRHWDKLYALNYLDVQHDGYALGDDFRASGADLDHFDTNLEGFANSIDPRNSDALNGARKVQRSIAGKIPRGRHRVTSCLAMELMLSDEERCDSLLNTFGVPRRLGTWMEFAADTKALTKRILADHRGVAKRLLPEAGEPRSGPETRYPGTERAVVVETREHFQLNLPADFDFASSLVPYTRGKVKEQSKRKSGARTGRTGTKRNYLHEAEANEAVGRAAEEFVIAFEKDKLKSRPDLAERIKWISRTDDGAGYDIVSYCLDGKEIHIEVKGTKDKLESEFYISSNELAVATELGASYKIYRVFDLATSPKICEIPTPIADTVDLEPVIFKATFR